MTTGDAKKTIPSDTQCLQKTLSEAEIMQLLQDLQQQYEEVMQLADFADIIDSSQDIYPRYSWDNPIGLIVTGSPDASLV